MPRLNVVLDKRRAKSNKTYPLKVRVHYKSSTFYIPLNIDLYSKDWDEVNTIVLDTHPNSKRINLVVRKKLIELEEIILGIPSEKLELFSAAQVKSLLLQESQDTITLSKYAREHVSKLQRMNRAGSAIAYSQAIHSLEGFAKRKTLAFSDITYSFLIKYEEQLLVEGKKKNSVSAYLRQIRALYNKAINEEVIPASIYPFNKYKIRTEKTVQRNLSEEQLRTIWNTKLDLNEQQEFALDLYRLMFLLIGINFSDLATLTTDNFVNGRLVYKRRKTKKIYSVKLTSEAWELFAKYDKTHDTYLLPILPQEKQSADRQKRTLTQKLKMTNKHLKNIGDKLGLKMSLTTYTSRYTWANIAKQMGYQNELIAEALGHSYGNRTTAIYLDNFDKDQVDKMNASIVTKIASPQG